jgi:hypothetical protein
MVAQQNRRLIGRNGQIWLDYINGTNVAALAEKYERTESRIYEILKQCQRDFPVEERVEIKNRILELLDVVKAECMQIALAPPKRMYAVNGRELPELDNSEKLQAVDRVVKILERYSKITGMDSAVTHTVSVTAEAQQATKDQADKVSQSLGSLFAATVPYANTRN